MTVITARKCFRHVVLVCVMVAKKNPFSPWFDVINERKRVSVVGGACSLQQTLLKDFLFRFLSCKKGKVFYENFLSLVNRLKDFNESLHSCNTRHG